MDTNVVDAVQLPKVYGTVVLTNTKSKVTVPATIFETVMKSIAKGSDVWVSFAGSTSHDVRANLMNIIASNIPPPKQSGMLLSMFFCAHDARDPGRWGRTKLPLGTRAHEALAAAVGAFPDRGPTRVGVGGPDDTSCRDRR